DALTGKANFDIAEYIALKLIEELCDEDLTIALLCKTSVARNVFQYLYDRGIPFSSGAIRSMDASQWFHVAVDACLFTVTLGAPQTPAVQVYASLTDTAPCAQITYRNHTLIAGVDDFPQFDQIYGKSRIEWRQGVKHDASSVMELSQD